MTKKIRCGALYIGGDAPVTIQSMANVPVCRLEEAFAQTKALFAAGCEIIRFAVPDEASAAAMGELRHRMHAEGITMPVVADIHFDYKLALLAIKNGADKIRINPGNIGSREKVAAVAEAAGAAGIPIRVGVNSGSLEKDILEKNGGVTAEGLAESALRNAAMLEDLGFRDIVLSLKASEPVLNYRAYRIVSEASDYPLHIGVTEAGTVRRGRVKSAAGIGGLLLAGIGDTMRVSFTGDPVQEVLFAREILEACGRRRPYCDIVSCPTCGRTRVDLESIVNRVEEQLEALYAGRADLPPGLRIAIMGCAVNGPGEAREADLGVACGDGKGVLFRKGEIVETVTEAEIVSGIIKLVEETGKK